MVTYVGGSSIKDRGIEAGQNYGRKQLFVGAPEEEGRTVNPRTGQLLGPCQKLCFLTSSPI